MVRYETPIIAQHDAHSHVWVTMATKEPSKNTNILPFKAYIVYLKNKLCDLPFYCLSLLRQNSLQN